MEQPVIAKEYRNHTLENIHQGVAVIVNEAKEIVYKKGDIEQPIFYRSAMKPLQAIPVFESGIIEKYQLTDEEAALFMASQRGEAYHQRALQQLQEKLALTDEDFICAASYPLNDAPKEAYLQAIQPKRRLLHNCAGKHLGFLGYAKGQGLDLTGYGEPSHPLQKEIKRYVSMFTEVPEEDIQSGVDGCGVPVHAVPLYHMALSYLKFAAPEQIKEQAARDAVVKMDKVMHAHPEMIASHDFICSVLLQDENIIAKGGAQGVYCLALKDEKISIALKVLSGTEDLWPLLVAKLLEKIEYKGTETIDRLYALYDGSIKNDDGITIGTTEIFVD